MRKLASKLAFQKSSSFFFSFQARYQYDFSTAAPYFIMHTVLGLKKKKIETGDCLWAYNSVLQ